MKPFLFFLLAFCLSVGCNDDQQKVKALKTETETLHDEAMKDMAEMNRVAREIKQFILSASMTPEQSQGYADALKAIGDAENDMMSWMRDYKDPSDKPAAEALEYLNAQKAAMEKNKADILAATAAGKKLLPQ
jgi:hypothetical protein